MKVLYVAGNSVDGPDATTEQLSRLAPDLAITTVVTTAEALAETRRGTGFLALVTSPWLAPNETLALIVSLRRDRVPIAIVPVVAESQRDFFASAVAAGADDVLLLRGDTLVRAQETLTRIRQSPHVTGAGERYRLRVLYAGRDANVWSLFEQIPFVAAERASCTPDGACLLRTAGTGGPALRCDAVVIDDPEEAHPLQILKSIKSQESDLPVVMLTPPNAGDVDTAALDLGADDSVPKNGLHRRRLIATLRRLHQRIEVTAQHVALRSREHRLREIVEILPQGLGVIGEDGLMLAVNAAALPLFGAARPTDVVGRDFLGFLRPEQREEVAAALGRISAGEPAAFVCDLDGDDRVRRRIALRGVRLERDARGGRGVLAVLEADGEAGSGADSVAAEEHQILLARLADAEGERDEWQESLRRERAAWDHAREELERRVARAEIERTTSADAEAAFVDAFTSERAAWDEARRAFETQVEAVQAELENKNAELAVHAADLAAREAERADFEARLESAHSQRQADRAAIDALERDAAASRADLDDLRRRLEAADAESGTLRRGLDAATLGARELEAELDRVRGLAASRQDGQRTIDEIQRELRHAADAHATERASWDAHRRDLESRLDEGDRARHDLQDRLGARDNQRLELEVRLDDAARVQRELEAELRRLAQDRQAIDAHVAALAHERDTLTRHLDTERQEHAALQARLREAHDRLAAHESDLEQLRHEQGPLLDRLRDAETARAAAAADLEAERRRLADDRQAIDAHVAALAHERDTLTRHLDTERQEHAALQARLRDAHDRLAALESDLQRLRHEHRPLLDRLRDAETARAATAAECDAAGRRIAWLEGELRGAHEARERVEHARGELAGVRAELEERNRGLEAQIRALEAARDGLESRIGEIDQASVRARAAEDTLRATRDELARIAEDHAAERAAWDAERHDLVAGLELSAREREDYERRLRQAEEIERERRRLEDELHAARGELAALVAAQAGERAARERAQRELDTMTGRTLEERARFEQALAAATDSRDRLLDSQLFGCGVLGADGRLLRCTDAFARIFGYGDAADAVARTADGPFPPLAGRQAVSERLMRERRIDRLDARLRRLDGRIIQVIESACLVTTASGAHEIEHTVVDVSAFMALEDRLRQSRRLEEVGTLAASMAPEIVRVLAEIDRCGRMLVEAVPQTDPRRHAVDALADRAAAAAELTRQLLAFSRRQLRPAETVDLHVVVARGESVWRRLIGSHIAFEMTFGARAAIAPNADDLDQLITAMIVAARDALPVGGKVVVETDRVELDATDLAGIDDATPGPRAALAVTSAGFGVERPTMPPVATLIARRSGAFVRTSGEPGRTASFEVYFPCVEEGR